MAQHHFNADEGGLPAPFVFLAHIVTQTSQIRLGTGVVTLPLENPMRVAEDAAVLDLLSGGRLEIGIGAGGTPSTFPVFGLVPAERAQIFSEKRDVLLNAWRGENLGGEANRLYPAAPYLLDHVWQGTFSSEGGRRAGRAGDGLMLSHTQPWPQATPDASLADIQNPIIDAYLATLPYSRAPHILASRSVFVADDRCDALRFAELGLGRFLNRLRKEGRPVPSGSLDQIIAGLDIHIGTPQAVIASLKADKTLDRATNLVVQVHSVDPPYGFILRSIELVACEVAPALGWIRQDAAQ